MTTAQAAVPDTRSSGNSQRASEYPASQNNEIINAAAFCDKPADPAVSRPADAPTFAQRASQLDGLNKVASTMRKSRKPTVGSSFAKQQAEVRIDSAYRCYLCITARPTHNGVGIEGLCS
jgi:hypothetical protein